MHHFTNSVKLSKVFINLVFQGNVWGLPLAKWDEGKRSVDATSGLTIPVYIYPLEASVMMCLAKGIIRDNH
jgi:hypothetical protein